MAKTFLLSIGGFCSLNNDLGIQMKVGYKNIYVGFGFDLNTFGTIFQKVPDRKNIMLGYNWFWQRKISFYTGAGYGVRNYYYYPNWYLSSIGVSGGASPIKIAENSAKGFDLEAGVNLLFTKNFGVFLGCNMLQFKYSDFSAGMVFKF